MGQTAAPPQPFAPQPTQPYQPPQQQQAYQPVQQPYQPYQLQQPYSAPARRKPGLGLPIVFLSARAVMAITGGALDPALLRHLRLLRRLRHGREPLDPGVALAATGGVFFTLGVVFLIIRLGQRRRWTREQAAPVQPQYGFAPIIAPERQLYGLAGTVSF